MTALAELRSEVGTYRQVRRASSGQWWGWLLVICAVALAVRVGYVALSYHPAVVGGDSYQYNYGANLLVQGKGFINAYTFETTGVRSQTALHSPLYMMALAVPSLVGLSSIRDHQIWSCVLGTATVAVIGCAGRRLGGARVGLVAAGIAAVYPNMWIDNAMITPEGLDMLLVAVALLAAYRLWQRPSVATSVVLGAACALAALTRGEGLALLPLVALPAALVVRLPLRRRLCLFGLAALAFATVLAPWFGFNLGRFDHPVYGTSTELGLAMALANCNATYAGSGTGYWSDSCYSTKAVPADESSANIYYRDQAISYAEAHIGRLPWVVFAREGRTWGFYKPLTQIADDVYVDGRTYGPALAGLGAYYALALAAVVGAWVLRRRRVPLWPLLGAVATTVATVALVYGSTRLRVDAEPALVLMGAVGLDAGLIAARHRWLGRRPAVA